MRQTKNAKKFHQNDTVKDTAMRQEMYSVAGCTFLAVTMAGKLQ